MEKLIRLFAVLLILGGLITAYTGYAFSGARAAAQSVPPIPVVNDIATALAGAMLAALPDGARDALDFAGSGLLFPMIIVTVLLFILSIVTFVVAGKVEVKLHIKNAPRVDWGHVDGSDDANFVSSAEPKKADKDKPAAAGGAEKAKKSGGGAKFQIDDSILDGGKPSNIFDKLEHVIALSLSSVNKEQVMEILQTLRPDILPLVARIDDGAQEKIGKQLLSHYILSKKREQKGISPEQFRQQDDRMNELSRETIARRFVPVNPDSIAEGMKSKIGHAFDLMEQPRIQQESLSQAEDWQDVSLRNIVEVMKMPLKGEEPAALPSSPAPAAAAASPPSPPQQ